MSDDNYWDEPAIKHLHPPLADISKMIFYFLQTRLIGPASVNGTVNGSSETGVNGAENDRNDNKIQNQQTNSKCLDDPNFSFDEPKASKQEDSAKISDNQSKAAVESQPQKNKKPSYRVLEDPELDLPAPAMGFKSDPMTTSIYQPKQ